MATKKCRYGKLKSPKGRRVCKKRPATKGRTGSKPKKNGRKCKFGVSKAGKRKGQCLKTKRTKKS